MQTQIERDMSEMKIMFQQLLSQSKKMESHLKEHNKILKEQNKKLKENLEEEKKRNKKTDKERRRKSNLLKEEKVERIMERNRLRRRKRYKKQHRIAKRNYARRAFRQKLIRDWRDECDKIVSKLDEDGIASLGLGAAGAICLTAATGPIGFIAGGVLYGAHFTKAHSAVSAEVPPIDMRRINQEVLVRYPSSNEDISDDETIPSNLLQLEEISSDDDDSDDFYILQRGIQQTIPCSSISTTVLTE